MEGECSKTKQSPNISWTFFSALEGNVGTLFFSENFPPYLKLFFSELKSLSCTRTRFLLGIGTRVLVWLPDMLWHCSLHQMTLFKDFDTKRSNLVIVYMCTCHCAPTGQKHLPLLQR